MLSGPTIRDSLFHAHRGAVEGAGGRAFAALLAGHPRLVGEIGDLDDQRLPLPVPAGITHPQLEIAAERRRLVDWDDLVDAMASTEHEHEAGRLEHGGRVRDARRASRAACPPGRHRIPGVEEIGPLVRVVADVVPFGERPRLPRDSGRPADRRRAPCPASRGTPWSGARLRSIPGRGPARRPPRTFSICRLYVSFSSFEKRSIGQADVAGNAGEIDALDVRLAVGEPFGDIVRIVRSGRRGRTASAGGRPCRWTSWWGRAGVGPARRPGAPTTRGRTCPRRNVWRRNARLSCRISFQPDDHLIRAAAPRSAEARPLDAPAKAEAYRWPQRSDRHRNRQKGDRKRPAQRTRHAE